jgi:hypothetical protein
MDERPRYPQRLSSMRSASYSDLRTDRASRSTSAHHGEFTPTSRSTGIRSTHPYPNLGVVSESIEQAPPTTAQLNFRSQQPLPALPSPNSTSRRGSNNLPFHRGSSHDSFISYASHGDVAPSQRSSQMTPAFPVGMRSAPELRSQSAMSQNSSWEEDVEFCYEAEAEATCNFEWDGDIYSHNRSSVESDGVVRLSRFVPFGVGPRGSAIIAPNATGHLLKRESNMNVGWRGFSQARQSAMLGTPPPRCVSASPGMDHIAESYDVQRSSTPSVVTKLGSSTTGTDDSSEPHSLRSDSTRDCTSSYSSYESMLRPMTLTQEARYSSTTSMSSAPELVESNKTSTPTEALSEPDTPTQVQTPFPTSVGSIADESKMHNKHLSKTFSLDLMRRPSAQSNRALLQAGREVQRNRPATPNRFSRLLLGRASPRPAVFPSDEQGWI